MTFSLLKYFSDTCSMGNAKLNVQKLCASMFMVFCHLELELSGCNKEVTALHSDNKYDAKFPLLKILYVQWKKISDQYKS